MFVSDVSLGSMSIGGNKWAASSGGSSGVSLFDVRGALKLASGAASELPVQKALPAPSSTVMLLGKPFRLMPDASPARAMLWGSVLAAWTVGGLCLHTARRLDIATAANVKDKLGDAMSPAAARVRVAMGPVRDYLRGGAASSSLTQLAAALRSHLLPTAPPLGPR